MDGIFTDFWEACGCRKIQCGCMETEEAYTNKDPEAAYPAEYFEKFSDSEQYTHKQNCDFEKIILFQ